LKKISERIKSVDEILNDAKELLKERINDSMSFSEIVNLLENLAHQVYLNEELEAIASYLKDSIPAEIKAIEDKERLIDELIKHIARLVQERIASDLPNIRRARAGSSAEKILQIALKEFEGIECEVLRKKKKEEYLPDIAVPNWEALINDPDNAVAIAIKRTLRERWREDTSIFLKFKNAVFVCISDKTDFGEDKIRAMLDEGMRVVFLPDKVYEQFKKLIVKNKAENVFYPLSYLPKFLKEILSKE